MYTSVDSETKKNAAKERIRNAIGGLLLAMSAFLILKQINPSLVALDLDFGKPLDKVEKSDFNPWEVFSFRNELKAREDALIESIHATLDRGEEQEALADSLRADADELIDQLAFDADRLDGPQLSVEETADINRAIVLAQIRATAIDTVVANQASMEKAFGEAQNTIKKTAYHDGNRGTQEQITNSVKRHKERINIAFNRAEAKLRPAIDLGVTVAQTDLTNLERYKNFLLAQIDDIAECQHRDPFANCFN